MYGLIASMAAGDRVARPSSKVPGVPITYRDDVKDVRPTKKRSKS